MSRIFKSASGHTFTQVEVDRLRYEARLAYLDGRNKRYADLTKQADKMAAELRPEPSPKSDPDAALTEALRWLFTAAPGAGRG